MTKRKISRIDPYDRFRPQNSKFHFSTTTHNSPSRKDIYGHKKVKLTAPEKGSPRSCRLEDSYRPARREKVTACADTDPKTSEYAFFKKLKKDASLGVRSHPLQKDADQSKKPESSDCSRERTSDVRVGNKGFNSSRIIKDTSTVKTDSLLSPGEAWNKSDAYSMSSMQKSSRGFGDILEPQGIISLEGNQCMHGEIFSRKRQKLRQCVADALFPDMEKLCSKGHDIVSILLSRLFPTSIQENKYQDPNPGKSVNATTGYDLLDSRESDAQFKEHHQIPTRKSNSNFSDHLLSSMFLRSDERIAPHAEFSNPGKVVNATSGYDFLDSWESGTQFKEHHHIPTRKFLELESSSYFSDHLSSPMFLRADERITPHAEFQNPGKEVNATTGYDLLDSRESDAQFNEHHQIPTRKLLELESSSYFSGHLLSPMFLGSDERITPHAEFSTSHFHKFQPLYSITEPECKFGGNPSFSAKSDVTLGFLYNEVLDATRYGLLDSQESDVRFKEHHQIPKTKLLEFESNSYIKDHLLSPILRRSNLRVIPHTEFPTSHSPKFLPLHSITESEGEFGGAPSFSAKSDATLGFLFNEQDHEIFTSNYFKELGKLERGPIPLLLEKDLECTTNEINLPISYKYAKSDMVPALSSLGNGEEQMLKNILGEYHYGPSPLLHDKPQPQESNTMLDSGLLRYQEFRFGKYVYEDQDGMDINFNHTALSLLQNKHHFKLPEDCKNDIDTSHVQDSIYLPPYQHWTKRVSNDYHRYHPDTEAWLKSSLNFISGRRCLSLTSSHMNYQSSNSSTLQLPQRESMSSLFNSNGNYEPEMDGGNHGEVHYHFREDLIGIYNSSFLRMSMQSDNGCTFPVDSSNYINEQEMLV